MATFGEARPDRPTEAGAVRYPVYTVGDFAGGAFAVLPGFLLMFYMTNIMGIAVALATLVVSVPRLIDLIAAPIIGALSDRTRTRFGRRRPWMLAGSLTLLLSFPLVWASPFGSPPASAYFILVMFVVATVAVTSFAVPFVALNSELAQDYRDRTTLNAWRTGYSCAGMMMAGAGAPLLVALGGGGRGGYRLMGILVGIAMASVIFVTFRAGREPRRIETAATPSLSAAFDAMRSNPSFLILVLINLLYVTGAGAAGAVMVYFVTYILQRGPEVLSLVFFVTTGSAILTIPLWTALAARTNKLVALAACFVPPLVAAALFYLMTAQSPLWLVAMIAALSGTCNGGVQLLLYSMFADSIRHGARRPPVADCSALLTGVFVSSEKLGFAIGGILAGAIFAATGLVATTEGVVAQPEGALRGIRLGLTVLPAVCYAACLLLLVFYRRFDRELQVASLADAPPQWMPPL